MEEHVVSASPLLPITSYLILGTLTLWKDHGMSGYDVKQVADRSLRYFYWSPAQSQVYTELQRLQACGFVAVQEIGKAPRPAKRLYRATSAGVAAFQHWLDTTQVERDILKSMFQLKLFFGYFQSLPNLLALVEERRAKVVKGLQLMEYKVKDLQERIAGPMKEVHLRYPLLTLHYRIAVDKAELGWIDDTRRQLQEWMSEDEEAVSVSGPHGERAGV